MDADLSSHTGEAGSGGEAVVLQCTSLAEIAHAGERDSVARRSCLHKRSAEIMCVPVHAADTFTVQQNALFRLQVARTDIPHTTAQMILDTLTN